MNVRRTLLAALCALPCGCSVQKYAVDKLGDALASTGTAFQSDDDPELIRDAAPFGLKVMESVLLESPEHRELLLACARNFTQYAWAFVQNEADAVEAQDYARAAVLRERARKLYARAKEYGLRGLEVAHEGFRLELGRDPHRAHAFLNRDDVPLVYWTATAWAAEIALSKDRPETVAEQPLVEGLLDRVLALDAAWDDGAVHTLLVAYEPSRIGGAAGADERARFHFERAVTLSGGRRAGPFVALAESVAIPRQDRALFDDCLAKARAIDVDAAPERRLENLLYQRRAECLASRASDLFLE